MGVQHSLLLGPLTHLAHYHSSLTSFAHIICSSAFLVQATLPSLVRISLTASFYQTVRLVRLGARGRLAWNLPRYFHPCSHQFQPSLRTAIMSSSEDDVPLVRANGRANGKLTPGNLAGICIPSGIIFTLRTPLFGVFHLHLSYHVSLQSFLSFYLFSLFLTFIYVITAPT